MEKKVQIQLTNLHFSILLKNNYEHLITLDADLSHDPNEIPIFMKELESNDFVIGSRYIKGGGSTMTGTRLFLSYFGNKFIKFILNINCNEQTSSYRGFNLNRFKNFDFQNISSKGYSFFMEMIFRIYKEGILIREIPIYLKDRIIGQSKIPRLELPRTFINLFKLKFFK